MSAATRNGSRPLFTPTQSKMLTILKDGMPHDLDELFSCLSDEIQPKRNVHVHLLAIRRVLRSHGQEVIYEMFDNRPHYRWVVLLDDCKCRKVFF